MRAVRDAEALPLVAAALALTWSLPIDPLWVLGLLAIGARGARRRRVRRPRPTRGELTAGAGSHFDPVVVDAFLGNLQAAATSRSRPALGVR